MSVGETVYTSDDRVVVTHKKHSTDWILQFKFAKERDEGIYECQVIFTARIRIHPLKEKIVYGPVLIKDATSFNGFYKWKTLFALGK